MYNFDIDENTQMLPLFPGKQCSDIGWMLIDITTYLIQLEAMYQKTRDERYREVLEKVKPSYLK